MNLGICSSKYVGYELLKYIFETGTSDIVVKFVIIDNKDVYKDKIIKLCKEHNVEYYNFNVNSDKFIYMVKEYSVDLIFMLWFPTIVKENTLNSVNIKFVNLHPSYLPWNRGMHPYYWTIVDNTPAGTTIHFIDKNIDEGEILFQTEIDVSITDTGESLYEKSLNETINLFKKNYNNIIDSNYNLKKVNTKNGSFHLSKHLNPHSEIDLDKKYKALDLINIIRARTFNSGDSSYFYLDGKKYEMRIEIKEC
tara:strand:+ start:114 stop:866 length:753 start_codon:yes stop_codon:yes gene_type:complete